MTAPVPTVCPSCEGEEFIEFEWESRTFTLPCPECCCLICGKPGQRRSECDRCFTAEDALAVRRADR